MMPESFKRPPFAMNARKAEAPPPEKKEREFPMKATCPRGFRTKERTRCPSRRGLEPRDVKEGVGGFMGLGASVFSLGVQGLRL